ncbi:MAG TPA: hypothetical protein VNP98_05675 [Chthoniobacterales bacterium]|nr:hypothetical protein [Chthoniobacterales bacterium]
MKFPFEVAFDEVIASPDSFVDAVFSSLASEFLIMPKGHGFVEYSDFVKGYEELKKVTGGFAELDPEKILPLVSRLPICLIVLRSMLGFTPSELAYVTTQRIGEPITQGFARTLDRKARTHPLKPLNLDGVVGKRLAAMVVSACGLLEQGCPSTPDGTIHRLQKADTVGGLNALQNLAGMGAPYAMLLYERFLGRPFAGHRDSVSELVGDGLESAIEEVLSRAGISFRKTRRAERVEGFDQAPDFIIPDEFNPKVIIEAKLTEDDGTARDKVTRIQHLNSISALPDGKQKFEVVACIAGRGFSVRREDMKKLLLATHGKVFTLKTLDRLVEWTHLAEFRTKYESVAP